MAEQISACKTCQCVKPRAIRAKNGRPVYWVGILKGTEDKGLLEIAVEISFLSYSMLNFPKLDKTCDWYCPKCFNLIIKKVRDNNVELTK